MVPVLQKKNVPLGAGGGLNVSDWWRMMDGLEVEWGWLDGMSWLDDVEWRVEDGEDDG